MENCKRIRHTISIKCDNCGCAFDKAKSEYKRNEKRENRHFCSLKCNFEYKRKSIINLKSICKFCGKEILYKKRNNSFCSSSCSASYNNKNRVGEKRTFSEEGIDNIRKASRLKYNVDEYYKNPNYCKECGELLNHKIKNRTFCKIICKRAFDKKNMTELNFYKSQCSFDFNLNDFKEEFDFELIKKFGWYSAKNRGNNLGGVSRDHMYSINEGFKKKIDAKIISHPANCKLMIHNDNSKKWTNSSITLDELENRIIKWNLKYGEFYKK